MHIAPRSETAPALLAELVDCHGDQPALIDGQARISYRLLAQHSDGFAQMLFHRGVGRGDRVGLLLRDGHEFVELLFAVAQVGAIAVTLNWRWTADEIGFAIDDSAPKVWFVGENVVSLAQAAAPDLARIVVGTDAASSVGTCDARLDMGAVQAGDPWLMLYTSGTTGRPKGCLLSHRGVIASARSTAQWLDLTPADCRFSPLPLFHVGGLSLLLAYLLSGSPTVIMPRGASAAEVVGSIIAERCTGASIPSTMFDQVLDLLSARRDETILKVVTGGGGMLPASHVERVLARSGAEMALGYGQTEVSGFAGLISAAQQLAHPTAATAILPGLQYRIVDDGAAAPVGKAGELQLRGPQVMIGYWNADDATAAAFQDGWLRTGDLFVEESPGMLGFAGRTKELIKSGGENVYPAEVENALKSHSAVADCAVIGVADERWGEAVKAFVVLVPGALASGDELSAWCRESIAPYKRPRYVEFLAAIPRTELGKPRRDVLKLASVLSDQKVN